MREICQIEIGQCGIQIGQQFWAKAIKEHSIDEDGKFVGDSDKSTQVTLENKFVPRSIIIDTDPSTIESVTDGRFKNLFDSGNIFCGEHPSENNCALVRYNYPVDFFSSVKERIRHEVESCDSIQSFQIVCALGGGTGSGIINNVLGFLREDYCDKYVESNVIYPSSSNCQNNPMEIYNSVLCSTQLSEHSDMKIVMDNEALYEISFKHNNIKDPSFNDFNGIVSDMLIHKSALVRFTGRGAHDFIYISNNMKPYPTMGYLLPSFVFNLSEDKYDDVIKGIHDNSSYLCTVSTKNETNLCNMSIVRGEIQSFEFEDKMLEYRNSTDYKQDGNIPAHCDIIECNLPPGEDQSKIMMLSNSTAIAQYTKSLAEAFESLFNKKAYLHLYTNQGLDEMELTENLSYLNEVTQNYLPKSQGDGEGEGEGDVE